MNLEYRYIFGDKRAARVAADLVLLGVPFHYWDMVGGWARFGVLECDVRFLERMSLHFFKRYPDEFPDAVSRAMCTSCRIGEPHVACPYVLEKEDALHHDRV